MSDYFKTFNDKISKSNNTMTKTSNHSSTVYGALVIPYASTKIYTWTFKIIKCGSITIGIDEADEKSIDDFFAGSENKNDINYGYAAWDGCIYSNDNATKYGDKFKNNGDVICMVLNMNNKTLSFAKNNKQFKAITVQHTTKGYKMCVCLQNKGESIELLSFSCSNANGGNNDDQKDNVSCSLCSKYELRVKDLGKQIDELSKNNKRLTDELDEVRKVNQSTLDDVIRENTNKGQQMESLKNKLQKLSNENDQYKQTTSRQQTNILSLQKTNETLKNEKIRLKQENDKLMDDHKELEITIQELKKEVKELKLANIDTAKYLEWENEEILQWIMSLENGRYLKYEAVLKQSLSDEQVKGTHLAKVDAIDVKGWGVKQFDDKKDLTQSIQELVQQNIAKNVGLNEGAPTAYIHH